MSEEFRAGAVRLVLDEGKTIGAVARELDLTPSSLAHWVKYAQADRTKGKTGLTTAEREELARLRKENRILQEEREITKKGGVLPMSARDAQWLLRLAAPSGIGACAARSPAPRVGARVV